MNSRTTRRRFLRTAAAGSALVENRSGKGRAILLAPDLVFSIVHIQQGLPVLRTASPPRMVPRR